MQLMEKPGTLSLFAVHAAGLWLRPTPGR